MTFQVLGPLRVAGDDGGDATPPGGLQRRLLLSLLVDAGGVVSTDRLADALWPDALPANYAAALHTHVFRLRKALPTLSIERHSDGYLLELDDHRCDADEFAAVITEAAAVRATDAWRAVQMVDQALGWWRGEPYLELADSNRAQADRARLVGLRLRGYDERFEALIDLGRHVEVVAELEALTVSHPTRERPHAQLMRALVGSGRSVDALRVFDRFRRALGDELGVDPSPELRELHDAILTGEATESRAVGHGPEAGLEPAIGAPHLPRLSSLFVARERELDVLAELLTQSRLVTLLGTGGVGKTRLAIETGRRLAAQFGDGVWLCELAGSSHGNALEPVATQLGIESRAGVGIERRVAEVLRHRRMLLILDNCEHVLDAVAPLVEQVVAMTDHVRVLATSRERLAVDGEQLFPVAPLSTTDDDEGAAAATRLFVDRAKAMQPGFVAEGPALDAVVQLCRRLDGLPLAIELAAARLHTMDVGEINSEIARGIGILSTGRRSAPRHRSLMASMQWSFDLLERDEQDALTRLSVFRSSFTVDGAAAVIDQPVSEARRLLAALSERSLLQRSAGTHSMLEPVRQFANEQSSETPGRAEAVDRHARFHLELVERLRTELRGSDPAKVTRQLDDAFVELRAVRDHFIAVGDADGLLRLVLNLNDYGMYHMRREVLTWGEDAAKVSDDPHDGRVADALAVAALGAWNRGDRRRFVQLSREAHDASIERTGAVSALVASNLGLFGLAEGNLVEGGDWYRHALTLADPDDSLFRSEAAATAVLCLAYDRDPRTVLEADRLLEQFCQDGDGFAAAWAWYAAGEALIAIDPAQAEVRLRRALEMARAGEAWFIAGVAGASLASLDVRKGEVERAIEHYRWLLPLWTRAEATVLWTVLRSTTELLARLGDGRTAAVLLSAVRTTPDGHALFGDDLARLDQLAIELRTRLGENAFEAATLEGSGLDVADAAEVALRCFDEY
ncbi:MAG: BTAD domain-containing putative transcriptional regulator [Acidimicrobiales bacterium]